MSRPSDALAAQQATDETFTGLLLGLGAVALLVGGVGVANTMVISVLERRAEIGLRRSLGATRGQIRLQFLAESLLLSALGGVGGVLLGAVVTAGLRRLPRAGRRSCRPGPVAGGVAATLGHRRGRRALPGDPGQPAVPDRGPGRPVTGTPRPPDGPGPGR